MRLVWILVAALVASTVAARQLLQSTTADAPADPGIIWTEDFDSPSTDQGFTEEDPAGVINTFYPVDYVTGNAAYYLDGTGIGATRCQIYWDYGAADFPVPVYGRFYIKVISSSSFDSFFVSGTDSSTWLGAPAFWIKGGKPNGSSFEWDVDMTGAAVEQTAALTTGVWTRVEYKYDATAGSVDWKLDGVSQTSVTGGSTGQEFRYIQIGNAANNDTEWLIDGYAISTNDWIGEADNHSVVSENFDDTINGDGYELTWDASNDTEDAVTWSDATYVTGTNSLFVDGSSVSGTNHWEYVDLGASSGYDDYTFRAYINIPSGQASSGDYVWINLNDGSSSATTYNNGRIAAIVDTSIGEIRGYIGGNHVQSTLGATDTWVRVELHYPSGDWQIDGVDQTSITADSTPQDLRYISIGGQSSASYTGDWYVDGIAIKDTTGLTGDDRWLGSFGIDFTARGDCVLAVGMTGTTTETDLSGEGNVLAETSGTIPTSTDVPLHYAGTSRDFEESDTEGLYDDSPATSWIRNIFQNVSVGFWYKPETEDLAWQAAVVADYYTTDNSRKHFWGRNDGEMYMIRTDAGTTARVIEDSGTDITTAGEWMHYGFNSALTELNYYTNGIYHNDDSHPSYNMYTNASTPTIAIGNRGPIGSANPSDGLIDQVVVFTNLLTSGEWYRLYKYGFKGKLGKDD